MSRGYAYSDALPDDHSLWPLSDPWCTSGDQVVDLVPAFVNPALYVAIGLSVACAIAARRCNRSFAELSRDPAARVSTPIRGS